MIFEKTHIDGVYIVDLEPHGDDRGSFARTFCKEEFQRIGADVEWVQSNTSNCVKQGTLRGFHFQIAPFSETKYIRCTKGKILDIAVDLRQESPTYLQHVQVELSQDNRRALLIPKHCAHAYLSLVDNVEIHYSVTEKYNALSERGVKFDDPKLNITLPIAVTTISEKDKNWPLIDENFGI